MMILERFYNKALAQASYLIGCGITREAIVLDPTLEVDQYRAFAESRSLRIIAVAETHIHADFLSGSYALARQTEAALYVSGEGGDPSEYALQSDVQVHFLRDGDNIRIGDLRLDVIHTPGHTPEHLAFKLTQSEQSKEVMCIFTGDFLFVGDVGRPDLLEKASGQGGSMENAARELFASLQKCSSWPDHSIIWPGHGAGSACGKSLGSVPVSSIGYERLTNWALRVADESEFVQQVLENQPEPPAYFSRMKRLNREPSALALEHEKLWQIREPGELQQIVGDGTLLVDIRSTAQFTQGHWRNSLHLPAGPNTVRWGGSAIDAETAFLLIADTQDLADEIARQLSLIGLGPAIGWVDASGLIEGKLAGLGLDIVREVKPEDLPQQDGQLIDVRDPDEFEKEHIPGAVNWPLPRLRRMAQTSSADGPLILHCQSGPRSVIASSVLKQLGWGNVTVLKGGLDAYKNAFVNSSSGETVAA